MKYAYYGMIQSFEAPFEYDENDPDVVFLSVETGLCSEQFINMKKSSIRLNLLALILADLAF